MHVRKGLTSYACIFNVHFHLYFEPMIGKYSYDMVIDLEILVLFFKQY